MVDGDKLSLPPDSPRSSHVVFICDPSAEADRLQAQLRGRGYPVVDVPLGLLSSRIRYEQPDLIVLDADAPDAEAIVEDIIGTSQGQVQILLLGDADGRLGELLAQFVGKVLGFQRPVDVEAVSVSVATLLGPPAQVGLVRSRAPRAPILMAATRRPVRVDSVSNFASEAPRPLTDAPPAFTPSLPPLPSDLAPPTTGNRSRPAPSSRQHLERTLGLSAETRAVLEQGRRRVRLSEVEVPRPYRLGSATDAELPGDSPFLDLLASRLESDEEPNTARADPSQLLSRSEPPFGFRPKTQPPEGPPVGAGAELNPAFVELDDFELAESTNPGRRPPRNDSDEITGTGREGTATGYDDIPPSSLAPASMSALEPSPASSRESRDSELPITVSEARRRRANSMDASARSELPLRSMARFVRERRSGVLVQQGPQGLRRLVFRDGDVLSATSSAESDSLAHFLRRSGRLGAEPSGPLPNAPRQAAAALVAAGLLAHDELNSTLTQHAEWITENVLSTGEALLPEVDPPPRVFDEPDVFGGRAGAEVFVRAVQATVSPRLAFELLGGGQLSWRSGPEKELAREAGAEARALDLAKTWSGAELEALCEQPNERLVTLLALAELGILTSGSSRESAAAAASPGNPNVDFGGSDPRRSMTSPERGPTSPERSPTSPERRPTSPSSPQRARAQAAQAFRERLRARLELVRAGDYFSVLGVDLHATRHEIDRAHAELRQQFAPDSVPAEEAGQTEQVDLVLSLVEEAYHVLSADERRERYRRALERQRSR